MRFLNPKTDFAFKRIFGSERSHDILLSFLNAILGLQSPYRIVALTLLDPYLAPKIRGMKDTYRYCWRIQASGSGLSKTGANTDHGGSNVPVD